MRSLKHDDMPPSMLHGYISYPPLNIHDQTSYIESVLKPTLETTQLVYP